MHVEGIVSDNINVSAALDCQLPSFDCALQVVLDRHSVDVMLLIIGTQLFKSFLWISALLLVPRE